MQAHAVFFPYQLCCRCALYLRNKLRKFVQTSQKPDYFITFTTKSKWPEIKESLFLGETPHERPDLACQVFKLKYDSLMDNILQKNVLGKVKAHTATIEWKIRTSHILWRRLTG